MSKEKNHDKWLKKASFEKFRDLFVEWYLPALRVEAHKLQELEKRIDKLEKPAEK